MYSNWKKTARFALALSLGACLCCAAAFVPARPACAQISFGKMREAAEKGTPAPKAADEEDADAFDVDPNEKNAEKDAPAPRRGAAISRRGTSAASNANAASARASDRVRAKKEQALATNGLAEAIADEPEEEEEEPTPAQVRETPNARAAQNGAKPADKSESEPAAAANGKRGPVLGKATSHKYRAGMVFGARPNGACSNIIGTAPVPMEFPEQKVRTLEEEFPRVAKVDYRDLREGGARQLVFKMRELKPGQTVQATALFEVTRYPMLPPTEPGLYEIPKKVPREYTRYLKSGPYIESTAKTVRTLAKETTKDYEGAWDKVAAILAYVRDNIEYKEVMVEKPMRGAMAALKTRDGDCEDMSALFIAMCRAIEVPARLVRVPGHCWAEFYLVDDEKEGYWFPAQVAGTEELGSLQDTRVILQKGDNFKLPETPKEESLYVKELFMGSVKENGPDPLHQFIQETDPKD